MISSASFSLHRHSESKSSGPLCSIILLHGGDSGISLSDERKFDTFSLGELDERLLALSDDENVGKTRGKGSSLSVLNVDDLIRTLVVLDVHECAHTTNIVTTSSVHSAAILEFNNGIDLTRLKV